MTLPSHMPLQGLLFQAAAAFGALSLIAANGFYMSRMQEDHGHILRDGILRDCAARHTSWLCAHLHEVGVAAQGAAGVTVVGFLLGEVPHDHSLVPAALQLRLNPLPSDGSWPPLRIRRSECALLHLLSPQQSGTAQLLCNRRSALTRRRVSPYITTKLL